MQQKVEEAPVTYYVAVSNPQTAHLGMLMRPADSKVVVTKGPSTIHINNPLDIGEQRLAGVFNVLFMGVWLILISIPLGFAILQDWKPWMLVFLAVCLLPLEGIGLFHFFAGIKMFVAPYSREVLHIGLRSFGVWKQRGEVKLDRHPLEPHPKRTLGESCSIVSVYLVPQKSDQTYDGKVKYPAHIEIKGGGATKEFGKGLSMLELEWLHFELVETLYTMKNASARGKPGLGIELGKIFEMERFLAI